MRHDKSLSHIYTINTDATEPVRRRVSFSAPPANASVIVVRASVVWSFQDILSFDMRVVGCRSLPPKATTVNAVVFEMQLFLMLASCPNYFNVMPHVFGDN